MVFLAGKLPNIWSCTVLATLVLSHKNWDCPNTHTQTHAHTHARTHAHTHTHKYTHTHAHTHAHTHTHTHTHTCGADRCATTLRVLNETHSCCLAASSGQLPAKCNVDFR